MGTLPDGLAVPDVESEVDDELIVPKVSEGAVVVLVEEPNKPPLGIGGSNELSEDVTGGIAVLLNLKEVKGIAGPVGPIVDDRGGVDGKDPKP